uniref:Uncharacterized protein n=1 Tax=Rhizophora mucronata TaxID=61149 RepID=A0A2P2QLE9_RHIMU
MKKHKNVSPCLPISLLSHSKHNSQVNSRTEIWL